jgi:hypothetical protein
MQVKCRSCSSRRGASSLAIGLMYASPPLVWATHPSQSLPRLPIVLSPPRSNSAPFGSPSPAHPNLHPRHRIPHPSHCHARAWATRHCHPSPHIPIAHPQPGPLSDLGGSPLHPPPPPHFFLAHPLSKAPPFICYPRIAFVPFVPIDPPIEPHSIFSSNLRTCPYSASKNSIIGISITNYRLGAKWAQPA